MHPAIEHLKGFLEKKPEDPVITLKIISILLQEGEADAARAEIAHVLSTYKKGARFPSRFYKPLIKSLSDLNWPGHLEMLLKDLEETYAEDLAEGDEPLKRLLRRGRKNLNLMIGIFPKKLHGEDWWKGPDERPLLGPEEHPESGSPFKSRLPGTFDEDTGTVCIYGHEDDGFLGGAAFQIEEADTYYQDACGPGPVEVIFYADDEIWVTNWGKK